MMGNSTVVKGSVWRTCTVCNVFTRCLSKHLQRNRCLAVSLRRRSK